MVPPVRPTSTCRLSGTTAAANSPSEAHATDALMSLREIHRQAAEHRLVHVRVAHDGQLEDEVARS